MISGMILGIAISNQDEKYNPDELGSTLWLYVTSTG